MVSIRTALALLVSLNVLSPVAYAGVDGSLPEARLTWRLGFGDAGRPLQTGYGLTVGYRSGEPDFPAAQLLELDVSDRAALARLAGLPLFRRDFTMQEAEGADPFAAESSPWYARKWVWWTAGGLALTAAASGGSGGETTLCTGVCNQNDTGNSGTTINGGGGTTINGVGDEGIGCVDDTCAVPCEADNRPAGCVGLTALPALSRSTFDPERIRWLDAGTGHMGDLIAR